LTGRGGGNNTRGAWFWWKGQGSKEKKDHRNRDAWASEVNAMIIQLSLVHNWNMHVLKNINASIEI